MAEGGYYLQRSAELKQEKLKNVETENCVDSDHETEAENNMKEVEMGQMGDRKRRKGRSRHIEEPQSLHNRMKCKCEEG